MGSRTWIKINCEKWLNGTIREESAELRGIWVDLLVLAGSGKYGDSGEIKITDSVGFLDGQIADLLQISTRKWLNVKKRLQQTDRICTSEKNVIGIVNWTKYQSEYERQKAQRIRDGILQRQTKSATESAELSAARDRDKRLEIEIRDREEENPPISPLSSEPSKEKNDNVKNFYPTTDQVVWFYQEKILLGGTVTEEMDKELRAACDRYTPALVNRALKEGIRQRKASWRYIMGILQNWSSEGKATAQKGYIEQ